MQRLRFKDWSRGTDSCGQICTLKALLRIHFLLHPFCLRHAHPHQSGDLLDNKPSSLPYFPSWNKPPNKDGGSCIPCGRVLPLCPPLRGYFKAGEDHPERLVYSSIIAEILLKPSIVGSLLLRSHYSAWREMDSLHETHYCGVNTVISLIPLMPNYHLRPPEYCQPVQILASAVLSVCSPHCLAGTPSVRPR